MRILFDTNVVLDVLLDREPFSTEAASLFSKFEIGVLSGYICATTITTNYYLARKAVGSESAKEKTQELMKLFEIAAVNRAVLEAAIASDFGDFEDAVVHEAAVQKGAHAIVTRDLKGFKNSKIDVFAPDDLNKMLQAIDDASPED